MRAGPLDRRIRIERKTVAQDAAGEEIETWATLSTRFASVGPVRDSERFLADQFLARAQTQFEVRYGTDILDLNPLDRIIYPPVADPEPHQIYDVLGVREIGRREGFRIIAQVRPEIGPIVENVPIIPSGQTFSFGQLTLAGAGSVTIDVIGGAPDTWAIVTDDPVNPGHWDLNTTTGVLSPSVAGVGSLVASYTLGITAGNSFGTSDEIEIAIDTLANTYSIINETELADWIALGVATVSGSTVALRPGDYAWVNDTLNDRLFTAITTLTSHDNTNRARFLSRGQLRNPTNLRFYQLEFFAEFDPIADFTGNTTGPALGILNTIDNFIVEECELSANLIEIFDLLDPITDITHYTWRGIFGSDGTSTIAAGGYHLINNEIHGSWRLINMPGGAADTITVRGNDLHDFGVDGITFPGADGQYIGWNDVHGTLASIGDTNHRDALQWIPGAGQMTENLIIVGNRLDAARSDGRSAVRDLQGIFMEDISSEVLEGNYINVRIAGNLIRGISVHGISLYNPIDCFVVNNTAVANTDWTTNPSAMMRIGTREHWTSVNSGGSIVADNAALGFPLFGSIGINNQIATPLTTGDPDSYDQLFTGPDFTSPDTLDELETAFTALMGGALATAIPRIGAIGGGYVDYVNRLADIPRLNHVAPFTFVDLIDQAPSTLITSSPVEIENIDAFDHDGAITTPSTVGALVQVSGDGSPELRITEDAGGTVIVTDWTATPTIVQEGQSLWAHTTTEAGQSQTSNVLIQVGDQSDTWSVTTQSALFVVQSVAFSDQTFDTQQQLQIPAGVSAGNTLVAIIRLGSSAITADPSGWTVVGSETADQGNLYVYRKLADGTEGGTTAIWTTGASSKSAISFYEISAEDGSVEATFAAATLDPPLHTPSGGDADYIWIAVTTTRRNDNNVTDAPVNYVDLIGAESTATNSSNSGECNIWTAHRNMAAASEDPGEFTWVGSIGTGPTAATISVRPASGFPATTSMFVRYATDAPENDTVTINEAFASTDVDTGNNWLVLPDSLDFAAPGTITAAAGTRVTFTTTGTLPAPLQMGTSYILSRVNPGNFRVYPVTTVSNQPGSLPEETPLYGQDYQQSVNPIVLTDGGTGTHTLHCGPLLQRLADLASSAYPALSAASNLNRMFELPNDGVGRPYIRSELVARDQDGSSYAIHGKGMEQEGDRFAARQEVQGVRTVWHFYVCQLTNTDIHNLAKAMPTQVNTTTGVMTALGQTGGHPFAATSTLRIRVRVAPVGAGSLPTGLAIDTDYWVRSLSGSTFALYPTEADAQADTNRIVPTTSPPHMDWMVWSPEKPGDLERQRDFAEHLEPAGSQNALSAMTGPLGSGFTILGPMSDFDSAGGDAGDVGTPGRDIGALVDAGNGVAEVSLFIPAGAVGPTRVDTGLPLASGIYWATRDPASSIRCRLHLSEADAIASIDVSTSASNCIKYNAAGDGWFQLEPTGSWHFRISTPASVTPNAPWLIPIDQLSAFTFKIDYFPDDPITVPRATLIHNGVVVAEYDASTDPKALLGTALNDGALAWMLFNSPQGHVAMEANIYDIAFGASTGAIDNADLIAHHTWAINKYGIVT